jgi:hypothetical protein
MAEIIVALISGGLAFLGTVVSNLSSAKKTDMNIRVSQAVTDAKIVELTREVREHNNFAQRIPVLEEKVKVANRRIDDLERGNRL